MSADTSTLDLASIYTRAADWLEAHEWCQGANARDVHGDIVAALDRESVHAACGVGALFQITDRDSANDAWTNLNRFVRGRSVFFTIWNDIPGRTKAEVIAKLREAAAASVAP